MAKKHNVRKKKRKENSEYEEEVLQVDRVTRVVKGGRRLRFRATVIIGNKKGKVAMATGKATEVATAIQKGIKTAKKDIMVVPIVPEVETIPHEIKVKHKAARIIIMPASVGTGIIAGGAVRKILELAGVKNVLSKSFGTNNKLVNAQATIKALHLLKPVRGGVKKKIAEKTEKMKEKKVQKSKDIEEKKQVIEKKEKE